jgi:hypothetical protein
MVLDAMVTQHVRIKTNAHMVNQDLCEGHPDNFQFGRTSFVNIEQAKQMLRCSFLHFDKRGRLRPVIFVGHALNNDVKLLRERFGFDVEAIGVVVATIDTQLLDLETRIVYEPRSRNCVAF